MTFGAAWAIAARDATANMVRVRKDILIYVMKGVESAFWEMAYRVNDESRKVLEIPISNYFVLICHATLSK